MTSQQYADGGSSPWHNKETMRDLYHGEGMSIAGIAEHFDIAYGTAQRWLKKHDIDRRTATRNQEGDWQDETTLRRLYFEEEMTMDEIAEKYGAGTSTIQGWMDRHGIERLSTHEKFSRRRRLEPAVLRAHNDGYERWRDTITDGTVYVHQLLAIAGGADPSELFAGASEVHHRNNIPWDNRAENLEVTTRSEHMKKVQIAHPDKGGSREEFERVNAARDVMLDE